MVLFNNKTMMIYLKWYMKTIAFIFKIQIVLSTLFLFLSCKQATIKNSEKEYIRLVLKKSEWKNKKIFLYRANDYQLIQSKSADSTGLINFKFKATNSSFYFLRDSLDYSVFEELYLSPDDSLFIDRSDSNVIGGNASFLNNYQYKLNENIFSNSELYNQRNYLAANSFIEATNGFRDQQLKFLNDYFEKKTPPEEFKNYILSKIKYQWFYDYLSYIRNHDLYVYGNSKPVPSDSLPYGFINDIELNEEKYHFSSIYSRLLDEFVYFKFNERTSDDSDSIKYSIEMNEKFDIITNGLTGLDRELALCYYSQNFTIYLTVLQENFYPLAKKIQSYYSSIKTNNYLYDKFMRNYSGLLTIAPGEPAPDFELPDSTGELLKLSDFKGKVVYVSFWGTWCGPCIASIPKYIELQKKFKGENDIVFLYIGLEYGEKEIKNWKSFLQKNEFPGIHLVAEKQFRNKSLEPYRLNFAPSYLLIDKKGNIVSPRAGRPDEKLEAILGKLLRD